MAVSKHGRQHGHAKPEKKRPPVTSNDCVWSPKRKHFFRIRSHASNRFSMAFQCEHCNRWVIRWRESFFQTRW